VCLLVFYYIVGLAGCLAGAISIAVFFLITIACFYVMKERQKALMEQRDVRMRFCTEFLNYIKILKIYNWEQQFAANITKERDEEFRRNLSLSKINVVISGLSWGINYYVSAAILVTLAMTGYHFTPGPIFA
jgi:ABC-type bacteriocin/lantibiotic exporter with double-glycine peptidase domain